MSLLYVIQARKNPQKRTEPAKYYLQARKRGVMDFETLLALLPRALRSTRTNFA